jgi:hypothetical protein
MFASRFEPYDALADAGRAAALYLRRRRGGEAGTGVSLETGSARQLGSRQAESSEQLLQERVML